ncbi:MAG: DNA-3-methyladenine glycosylase [Chloroflexi bacterium]|nr:DNA-3-methyladenine glycosylase [Chloroflexota bacterium]|tara:strand:+ start:298 stop:900 length:603 start_codon:yes stop_codon:yes gene_type:complete
MSKPIFWNHACEELSKKDKVIKLIINKYNKDYIIESKNPFKTLCRSIISQQISTTAAKSIYEKFELLSSLIPDKIIKTSDYEFRKIGLSKQKISYIKTLSEKVNSEKINLVKLKTLQPEKTFKTLTELKGIGPWTANIFLMFYCLNANIFPSNDLGLKNGLKKFYKNSNQLNTIKNLWDPWCSVGTFYIWRALDGEPLNY